MEPPSMYTDVRPTLDNPSAAGDRMAVFVREALLGLTLAWDSYNTSAPSTLSSIVSVAEMDGSNSKGGGGKQ